jgi:tetratricopeptide (TPR) repeat protein
VAEGAGDGSGRATGVPPGALTALLAEVAAAPEPREAEPPSLLPGTVIGRFEILRELGRGGFGVVYEARDRDLGRPVALKFVRPGRVKEEEGRVTREAEAIARLTHPNLITLHDVGRSDSGPYLVFELLRGKTLQERMDDGPMPVQEAVHIATEVARGLAHAHAEGVMHRDLKPSNVFLTSRGQVKLLDFGMAHAFGRRRLSGGTPAYMAPEQWEDEPEDERTDVFALGVMLHRMLSGEYPFPEGRGRWSSEAATVPKLDVPGAPGLPELVGQMLDRATRARPRDGAAVLVALMPIEDALRAKPTDHSAPTHAKRRKATIGDLLAELKRRHVFRVIVGYGIFAFAVLQVTEPIMHGAELPDWVLKVVLAALALGFPFAVVLAWVYDLTAQGVKRTQSTGAGGPLSGRARLLLPLAVSVAVLAVAASGAGAWYAWKVASERGHRAAPATAAAADGRTVVAVADFANGTGEKQLDAMTGLLITSLEQSKKLLLLTRGRMTDVARQAGLPSETLDEVVGRSVGHRAGAAFLLIPAVHKLGATYVVELRALDLAKDQYRFTVKETAASQDDLVGLIDRLSDRTRQELRETPAEVAGARVEIGNAVTHSLEAYQHYLRARETRLRTCDFVAAAKEARRALELDPEMGAAHMELAVNLMNLGDDEESRRHFQLSRDRTARLPDKERRIVEVDTFMTNSVPVPGDREVQRQTVMRGVDELLTRYPQDEFVAYFAGQAHMYFRQWEQALEYYRRSLELDPGQCYVVDMVGPVLTRLGREAEILPLARRAVEARPNAANLAILANALRASEPEEAARRAREAIREASSGQARAIIDAACTLASTGHADETASATRRLAREGLDEGTRRWGREFPVIVAAVQGRPGEAARLFESARNVAPGTPTYLNPRATILSVGRAGNDAPAAAAELRSGPDVILRAGELALYGDLPGATKAAQSLPAGSPPEVHHRTVRAAVERGWEEAVPALRSAVAALKEIDVGKGDARMVWLFEARLLLGQALVEIGDPAGAVEVLRQVDFIGLCSTQAAAQVPGMLVGRARAYEKLGRSTEALKDLDRLLGLWKNAEPGLPLHAEAKAMRARLVGSVR